jgi:ribonuclease VapC
MHVETSAVVGILMEEPEAKELLGRLNADDNRITSVVNAVEAALSIGRRIRDYPLAGRLVADFLDKADIGILPVPPDLYDDVVRAYSRYGKGTGHPAKLNIGDCFSYAFAKRSGHDLLYKGNDFSQTDLAGK